MNPLISSEELKSKFVDFARKSDSKLSVILGAGASFGYSKNNDHRHSPPMVSGLLDEDNNLLVREVIKRSTHSAIKGQRAHIVRSIKSFGGDLEAYLSDIYANDTADNLFPSMLRYLEDIFTLASLEVDLDDNNYQSLISKVRDLRGQKQWSILNFNYDTILEQSIADLPRFIHNRTFRTDSDYLSSNPKVLKMHGGVNFRYITILPQERVDNPSFHEIFTNMMSSKEPVENYFKIEQMKSIVPNFTEYRALKDNGKYIICNFPLMMIPIHTITGGENSFFCRQIEYAKNEISQSKLVIAIGYQFGDNTFVNTLKSLDLKESNLILVGSNHLVEKNIDSMAYKAASEAWPKENISIYEGVGFDEFVAALY